MCLPLNRFALSSITFLLLFIFNVPTSLAIDPPDPPPPPDTRDVQVGAAPVNQTAKEIVEGTVKTINLVLTNNADKAGPQVSIAENTCYMIQGKNFEVSKGEDGDNPLEGVLAVQRSGDQRRDVCPYKGDIPKMGDFKVIPENLIWPNFLEVTKKDGSKEYILRLIARYICSNMEGPRTNCANPFKKELFNVNRDDAYKVRLIRVNYSTKPGETEVVKDYTPLKPSNGDGDGYMVINLEEKTPDSGDIPDPRFGSDLDTGFGKIGTDAYSIAEFVFRFGLGVGGGLAFLLMVFGAYRLIFSAGNPDAIQQGREVITAAVIGLVIIASAVFLLQLIGINVLGIPL